MRVTEAANDLNLAVSELTRTKAYKTDHHQDDRDDQVDAYEKKN